MSGIAERLRLLRGDVSQSEFASVIQLKQTTYGQYERGVTIPDSNTLSAICRAFRVNPRWLLLGEEPIYDDDFTQMTHVINQWQRSTIGTPMPEQAAEQAPERRLKMKDILLALDVAGEKAEDIEDPELRALAVKLQQHVADLRKQLAEANKELLQAKDEASRANAEAVTAYKRLVENMRPPTDKQ